MAAASEGRNCLKNVGNDSRAKLMFYLDCISNVIPSMKTDPGFTRLCDYKRFDNLTDEEEERLLKYGLQFGPPMLKNKCLFEKNSHACKHGFYEMGEAKRKFTVVESIQIEGRQIPVHKVMTYNECWIHRYHSEPIADITAKQESLKNTRADQARVLNKIKAEQPDEPRVSAAERQKQEQELDHWAMERELKQAKAKSEQLQQNIHQLTNNEQELRQKNEALEVRVKKLEKGKCSIM